MRILVCGGRDYTDKKRVWSVLDALCTEFNLWHESDGYGYGNTLPKDVTIITGDARGADSFAQGWSVYNWTPYEVYPANWSKHGKAADFIRNQKMLDEARPDLVIAFPGGTGTADMVNRAYAADIPVRIILP